MSAGGRSRRIRPRPPMSGGERAWCAGGLEHRGLVVGAVDGADEAAQLGVLDDLAAAAWRSCLERVDGSGHAHRSARVETFDQQAGEDVGAKHWSGAGCCALNQSNAYNGRRAGGDLRR